MASKGKRYEGGHGYVDCACRDCFDAAVCSAPLGEVHKPEHHMCGDCTDAGCEPFTGDEQARGQDCRNPNAYGGSDGEG